MNKVQFSDNVSEWRPVGPRRWQQFMPDGKPVSSMRCGIRGLRMLKRIDREDGTTTREQFRYWSPR